MKVGQQMSILESALPEDWVAPYRAQLTALQDSAPPMPTQTVRDIIEGDLGPGWRDQLVEFDPMPAAAASIGQVHQGTWADGRRVAVKVQYPGADQALMSDLRQIARLAKTVGTMLPGIDVKPLVEELIDRARDELDYALEAEAQHAFAVAFRDHPDDRRARRRRARRAGAGHGVARQHQLTRGRDPRRHPGGARPLRRAVRAVPVRRPVAHRHAARRPAPGQLPGDPERRRLPRPARRARLRRRGPAPRRRAAGGDGQPDPDRLPAQRRAAARRAAPGGLRAAEREDRARRS